MARSQLLLDDDALHMFFTPQEVASASYERFTGERRWVITAHIGEQCIAVEGKNCPSETTHGAGPRRRRRVPSALKAKTKQPPGKPVAPDSAVIEP